MATSDNKKSPIKTPETLTHVGPKLKEPASILIYVGPNMGGNLPMSQFTTYRGGLPAPVADRFNADPEFSRLFCPVEELNDARAELKDPASVRARAFASVLKAGKERK